MIPRSLGLSHLHLPPSTALDLDLDPHLQPAIRVERYRPTPGMIPCSWPAL